MSQTAHSIFMVRPAHFGFNEQTAASNVFQNLPDENYDLAEKAKIEFDTAVAQLRSAGVKIRVFEDDADTIRPDAVFPNNWISTHEDGTLVLYPMCTPNRRLERSLDIVAEFETNFQVRRILDFTGAEEEQQFLEGTGSIVFDHKARKAYACLSPRTSENLLKKLCSELNYHPIIFRSTDPKGTEVYHTNVIMGIAADYAIVCLESIGNEREQEQVVTALVESGKEIIDINWEQTLQFAGNVLELEDTEGNSLLALSAKAFAAFTPKQIEQIEKYSTLVPLAIPTIETIGGGSVRCMIAQNFLPQK
jgi:hypothetical protein